MRVGTVRRVGMVSLFLLKENFSVFWLLRCSIERTANARRARLACLRVSPPSLEWDSVTNHIKYHDTAKKTTPSNTKRRSSNQLSTAYSLLCTLLLAFVSLPQEWHCEEDRSLEIRRILASPLMIKPTLSTMPLDDYQQTILPYI